MGLLRVISKVIVALIATLLPVGMTAQSRDSTADSTVQQVQRLRSIEVTGSMLPRTTPAVGATSGIGTRILPGDRLALKSARSLANFLTATGTTAAYDDLGSRLKPTIVMRGFAAGPVVGLPQGISVFLDGIPVNEVDAGQVNLELLPVDEMRQLELFSSVTALLGPNTMGGAMNLVTRQGGDVFEGALTVGGSSFGGMEGQAFASGAAGEWKLLGSVASDGEDGWRQRTTSRVQRALLNAQRGDWMRNVRMQFLAARSVAQTAGSLPESVFDVMPDSNLTGGDFEDVTQLHLAVSGATPFAMGHAAASAWFRDNSAQRFNVNQINDPDVRSFTRTQTAGVLADWEAGRDGSTNVKFRSGAGASFTSSEIRIYAERIDPGLTTQVRTPVTRLDIFSEASAQRGRATLSGGLRLDVVRVPFRNVLDPRRDTTSTFTALNPRATLAIDITRNTTAWAGIVRSFRVPAIIEIACADPEEPCPLPFALGDDPPISPVVAVTREVGASWKSRRLQLDATLYRTNVQDEIVLFPYDEEGEPEGSTIDGFFANIPRTRREGLDVSAMLVLRTAARFSINVSTTRATFQTGDIELFSIREPGGDENEVEVGDVMPLVPDRRVTFRAESSPLHRVRVGWNTRYTGKQWLRGDEANDTAPLDGYWVSDAHAALRIGRWELQGAVRNLFDARYASFGTFNINQGADNMLERFLTPGQVRTVSLRLSRNFGTVSN